MEIEHIRKYDEEKSHLAFVHDQIINRIDNVLTKQYNVNYITDSMYFIYKKPIYSNNIIYSIIQHIVYNIDFLIQDVLKSNKYYITSFIVKNNKIELSVNSQAESKIMENNLQFWFNGIDDVKGNIVHLYYGDAYK